MNKEKATIWLDRIMEFSLCVLIFTLPFSKSMIEISFSLALACWVAKRCINYRSVGLSKKLKEKISGLIKAFKPVKTDLNLPIAGFVFIALLSTIKSVSLILSLEGLFFKLFEWIMIYFIVVETVNSKKRLNRMLKVMFFSMVLITIDGLFQYITGTDFIRNYKASHDIYALGSRIRASFGHPNGFAGWLVVMIPLALSLSYSGTKRAIKPILWIIAGFLIFCLILTYSRGAWIAAVLSLIFLTIFKSKRLFITTIIILLILSFVLPASTKGRLISIVKISETVKERTILWQEALKIIKDFPLLGCGLSTYTVVGPGYKITEGTGYYPHNSYLHMAAEIGLLGLGMFIWIMVTLFKTTLANFKRIDDRFYRAILIGLLAGLFGFLLHSFVDTNIHTLQLGNLMWFIMGLIIATQRISLER